MRKMVLLLALTLLALPALADSPAVSDLPQPEVVTLGDLFQVGIAAPACSEPESASTAALVPECPWEAPSCRQRSDCDKFCGGPDWGYCNTEYWCCLCLA